MKTEKETRNLQFFYNDSGYCSEFWEHDNKIYCYRGRCLKSEKLIRERIETVYNTHISIKKICKSSFTNKNGKMMFCIEKDKL